MHAKFLSCSFQQRTEPFSILPYSKPVQAIAKNTELHASTRSDGKQQSEESLKRLATSQSKTALRKELHLYTLHQVGDDFCALRNGLFSEGNGKFYTFACSVRTKILHTDIFISRFKIITDPFCLLEAKEYPFRYSRNPKNPS